MVQTITRNEFYNLMEIVTPENGQQCRTNFYREWLKNAYQLALLTGIRANEIVNLRWSDILFDAATNTFYLEFFSRKTRRIVRCRITPEVDEILIDLGGNQYEATEYYILDPRNMNRNEVSILLNKSFTHYHAQLDTTENKSFKCLRRTFIIERTIHVPIN